MAMNAQALKADLKGDFILIFDACEEGEGLSRQEYADRMATSIATRFVEHLTRDAELDGMAGGYPVTGKVK